MIRYPSRAWSRRIFKALIYLSLILYLTHAIGPLIFSKRRFDTWAWESCAGHSPFNRSCPAPRAALARDVQIVVKTGGSEPQSRLRSQLASMLAQVPKANMVVFSDLDEEVEGVRVHDVYAGMAKAERVGYPAFALYHELQKYKQLGKDTRTLEGGWDLARYMNLAMKRRIWEMQVERTLSERSKWFVFVDTDTFVEWDNLLAFLERFDARKKWYLGSPVWIPKMPFAHGGSAYILSYGALEALNVDLPARGGSELGAPMYSQFGVNTTALCCGDEALAIALKERGIGLKGYWPLLNGEIPATVGFGREIWCEPVLSLHHVSGTDIENLWQWVEDWKVKTRGMRPLLFKDLFEYVAPQFVSKLKDWDNTEDWKIYQKDNKKDSVMSFEQCEAACEADKFCFQFVLHVTRCALSHTIRLGRKRVVGNGGDDQYTSGWNLRRIRNWTAETKCSSAHWLHSNP